jgi:large subunit ribosomal protein L19
MSEAATKINAGMIVKVHQRITDVNSKGEEKQRTQIFEGMVLAAKHGNESGATITVRKVSNGVGVEKIFPIHSPVVEKIEVVREMSVRQSRPFYLRDHKKKLREKKTATK